MNRTAVRALAGLGALAVLVALAVALVGADLPTEDVDRAVRLAGVLAFLAGLYHLWRLATDTGGYALAPWSVGGSIVPGRPEETPSAHPLSGERLAGTLEEAERAARRDRRVEDGLDVVRPALRESLLAALVRGGRDREAAEEALAAGTWAVAPSTGVANIAGSFVLGWLAGRWATGGESVASPTARCRWTSRLRRSSSTSAAAPISRSRASSPRRPSAA